jgi:hypothetical protein
MKISFTWIAALLLFSQPVLGQAPAPAVKQWSFYASALGYVLPEGASYAAPVLTADRDKLHLEARYNYEALGTGSLWIGRNFSVGNSNTLELTAMLGGVFGKSDGIAPGLRAAVQVHKFGVESEIEYLIEVDRSDSFFYSWTEVYYAPREWVRVGAVVQRTKAYQTQFDVQRGVLAGVSWKRLDFTTYILDPGAGEPVTVFGAGFSF